MSVTDIKEDMALAKVAFAKAYGAVDGKPRVVLSPVNLAAVRSGVYVDYASITNRHFILHSSGSTLAADAELIFNYTVIE